MELSSEIAYALMLFLYCVLTSAFIICI